MFDLVQLYLVHLEPAGFLQSRLLLLLHGLQLGLELLPLLLQLVGFLYRLVQLAGQARKLDPGRPL